MKNWTEEHYGIPHKNGMVRFYFVGVGIDVFGYLGWFDMTDWDKGWDKVMEAVEANPFSNNEDFQVLRHDQLLDLMRNTQLALEEALEDKDEKIFL